jgi:hypothetical protein
MWILRIVYKRNSKGELIKINKNKELDKYHIDNL